MEPPSIPDNRPHRKQAVSHIIGKIVAPVPRSFAQDPLRSNSPAGQGSKPPIFGQPAFGRPPPAPRQPSAQSRPPSRQPESVNGFQNGSNGCDGSNGQHSARRHSTGGDSVAESMATLDLGHHSIGQPQSQPRSEKRSSMSSNDLDKRSASGLSLDQQSVGNQSLGHHSIGGPSGDYYS